MRNAASVLPEPVGRRDEHVPAGRGSRARRRAADRWRAANRDAEPVGRPAGGSRASEVAVSTAGMCRSSLQQYPVAHASPCVVPVPHATACAASMPSRLTRATLDDAVHALGKRQTAGWPASPRHHGLPPLWARPRGYATLALIILEQQVSLASARSAYARLRAAGSATSPRVSVLAGRRHGRPAGGRAHASEEPLPRRARPGLRRMGPSDSRPARASVRRRRCTTTLVGGDRRRPLDGPHLPADGAAATGRVADPRPGAPRGVSATDRGATGDRRGAGIHRRTVAPPPVGRGAHALALLPEREATTDQAARRRHALSAYEAAASLRGGLRPRGGRDERGGEDGRGGGGPAQRRTFSHAWWKRVARRWASSPPSVGRRR